MQEREEIYFPYGGERWTSGTDPNHYKFTGKERDSETGLDYFGARYFSSTISRFMSPDWAPNATAVPYANYGNPQSLNLYGYVRNNPTTFADPDGHNPANDFDYAWDNSSAYGGDIHSEGKDTFWDEYDEAQAFAKARTGQSGQRAVQQQLNNVALAGKASSREGSTHWAASNKTKYPAGKDKCNEFVGDMIESVGRTRPRVPYTGIRGWLFHMTRDPTAKEWATIPIPGYSAPMPIWTAAKGDIIALGHLNNEEGHVGIYVGGSSVASANWFQGGTITVNSWGFRAAGQNDERSPAEVPVVRKWLGEQ